MSALRPYQASTPLGLALQSNRSAVAQIAICGVTKLSVMLIEQDR
jgi:hypothetical protein